MQASTTTSTPYSILQAMYLIHLSQLNNHSKIFSGAVPNVTFPHNCSGNLHNHRFRGALQYRHRL